ncbi:MAG: trehalose-6-phosphate synthase [candidate division Zixibacteria bacterium]|nr:trehalose-6-phosphate synthase [candidate division Zixibacteria bacterium]NIR65941.1 trehalose-6-phosphate synthase [candidate division Zixibacteria bacterium]NIS16635.1 trehalose-6-phosphate synthase [candidate division Zixibacteria bacterium]NIS47585.1 trehalose-6-phosphate synthase [candidate division Zixibacteria bacterium]NIT53005.1 trehalose-6-phosphate synthase [candidate division Zixibacteria bacterium]
MDKITWRRSKRRLLVVSNRLPICIKSDGGRMEIQPGSGGLVTALAPIIRNTGGVWIGWPGCELTPEVDRLIRNYNIEHLFNLQAINISEEEVENYYRGFSNEAVWPLFHDLLGQCKFEGEHWEYYRNVNRRFAEKILEIAEPGDLIWIHDYHLIMVAHYLRQMNVQHPLAFFLHTPFPNYDLLRRLPWKDHIIGGLLDYDLIGFQTRRDRRNFCRCAKELIPSLDIKAFYRHSNVHYGRREIKVGNFPISIDFSEFSDGARAEEVEKEANYLKQKCQSKSLVLGVDRLDYTKGIPERFLAYERALEKYPELRGNICLLQLAVPSRSHLSAYQDIRETLEWMVGRINGRFSEFGWQAIQYIYRSVSRTELLGFYRACDIGLLTPLRDGMNLVAKEFCASTVDNNGVLILSEFAGASEQLSKGAIMVNPYNREETADAIYQAYNMDLAERARRMNILRSEVKRNDIFRWVEWFLSSFREYEREEAASAIHPNNRQPVRSRVESAVIESIRNGGNHYDTD